MEGWAPGRKRSRVPLEERLNRDGRWVRQFSARSDFWPIFEHWASETDVRLAAVRGQRRLYVKGAESRFYKCFVDIRAEGEGRGVTLVAWIEVQWLPRLLSGYQLPIELQPDPAGSLLSLRVRRGLCRLLNTLLERLKQTPIIGSTTFHPLDLDASSLTMTVAMGASTAGFLVPLVRHVEIRAGLANGLLALVGRQALVALGTAAPLLLAQMIVARRYRAFLWRWLSAGGGFLFFFAMTVLLFTRTASEMDEAKFAYHCLAHFNEPHCRDAILRFPPGDRENYLARLRAIEKELSFSYPRSAAPRR